jgi:hypothetical protein
VVLLVFLDWLEFQVFMAQQDCLEYRESRVNQALLGQRAEQGRPGPLEQQVKNHLN